MFCLVTGQRNLLRFPALYGGVKNPRQLDTTMKYYWNGIVKLTSFNSNNIRKTNSTKF